MLKLITIDSSRFTFSATYTNPVSLPFNRHPELSRKRRRLRTTRRETKRRREARGKESSQ